MSESTAREARRDLRRTVGLGALETLRGQEQSIASVAASVNSLQGDVRGLARILGKLREDSANGVESVHKEVLALAEVVRCLQEDHDELARDHDELARATFWGRLRWLVTGR